MKKQILIFLLFVGCTAKQVESPKVLVEEKPVITEESKWPYTEEVKEYSVMCVNAVGQVVVRSIDATDVRFNYSVFGDAGQYDWTVEYRNKKFGEYKSIHIDRGDCNFVHFRTGLWIVDKQNPNGKFQKYIWTHPKAKFPKK